LDKAHESEKIPTTAVEVVDQVTPLIQSLPKEKQVEVRRIVTTAMSFQGPLPPPEILAQYGEIIPHGAERLMVLLEKQTDHRISIESRLVEARVSTTSNGQRIAAGLSVFFGLVAAFLGYTGHDILAGSIGVTTIVGLAVVFVLGKEPGRKTLPGEETPPLKPTPGARRKKT
jgi:uncharacterized membrane protein